MNQAKTPKNKLQKQVLSICGQQQYQNYVAQIPEFTEVETVDDWVATAFGSLKAAHKGELTDTINTIQETGVISYCGDPHKPGPIIVCGRLLGVLGKTVRTFESPNGCLNMVEITDDSVYNKLFAFLLWDCDQ